MTMKTIIPPQTDAATFTLKVPAAQIYTVSSGKLVSAEVVTFQLDEEGVGSPGDLYQDGDIRQLTATHNAMLIQGPIDVIVSKSVTAAAVGVYVKGG